MIISVNDYDVCKLQIVRLMSLQFLTSVYKQINSKFYYDCTQKNQQNEELEHLLFTYDCIGAKHNFQCRFLVIFHKQNHKRTIISNYKT